MNSLKKLLTKVKKNDFTLGVVGIGRVGLPLALVFANVGVRVIGFDQNKDCIGKIKHSIAPFSEAGMQELLGSKNFEPVFCRNAGAKVKACDIYIVCVGTPLTASYHIDYGQLFSALDMILQSPLRGKLVILRSTVPPGTLEERVLPFIEAKSGLKAGVDFGAASCPERIVEGHAIEEIIQLPEIVGGVNPISGDITAELFKKINHSKKILRTTSKSAELAKLYANMYRYVNFALANEFALLAEEFGQDGTEIINTVNYKYPRGGIPRPGLVGGPCLTKDGYFLLSNTAFPDLILLASRLNEFMPQHIVNRLRLKMAEKGKVLHALKVGLLGTAFKGGSDDERYSPSIKIAELLESENVIVVRHDPHVKGTESFQKAVKDADVIVLATNHPEFADILPRIHKLRKKGDACVIFDCWDMLDKRTAKKYGFDYMKLGSK
ncbi:MAG: nucleotide sugar dehydrogenase [Dehalococcoidia bacterium]|jgi:UDP-N-acetyl-D-mannosaminuronic acid dehydrogenase